MLWTGSGGRTDVIAEQKNDDEMPKTDAPGPAEPEVIVEDDDPWDGFSLDDVTYRSRDPFSSRDQARE